MICFKCQLFLLLYIMLCINSSALGNAIYIPGDYQSIQAGINASFNGDTILVDSGNYPELINFCGKNIVLGSLYLTTGDTSLISSTIISGSDERGRLVSFTNGESNSSKIIGFTIQHYSGGLDGAVNCDSSDPTISYCYIQGNRSLSDGGGIRCVNASPIIEHNTISDNEAGFYTRAGSGGGIYCNENSNPNIENNIIIGNKALTGGGIACINQSNAIIANNNIINNNADIGAGLQIMSDSNPQIRNNTIIGNFGMLYGGGMYITGSSPLVEFNVIAENLMETSGGGLFLHNCFSEFTNNTISRNTASDSVGAIWHYHSGVEFVNTIIWDNYAPCHREIYISGNFPQFSYCDIVGGSQGVGNISEDPIFVDPINNDYNLNPGSPCINAGDPDSPLDPDGTRCDMGALYCEQILDIDNEHILPSDYHLKQNYPNPFNQSTILAFDLPERLSVKLNIYTIDGRLAETVVDTEMPAGTHSLLWNADDLASGIYFYKIMTNSFSETRRMLLLK